MNDGIHMTENYIHYVFAFEFGNMSFIIQRYIFQNSNLHRSYLSILKDVTAVIKVNQS